MHYQITARRGGRHHRYHTFVVEAPDASSALRAAADELPADMAAEVDLVELRIAVDPEERTYLGEDEGPRHEPSRRRSRGWNP